MISNEINLSIIIKNINEKFLKVGFWNFLLKLININKKKTKNHIKLVKKVNRL